MRFYYGRSGRYRGSSMGCGGQLVLFFLGLGAFLLAVAWPLALGLQWWYAAPLEAVWLLTIAGVAGYVSSRKNRARAARNTSTTPAPGVPESQAKYSDRR